MIHALRRKKKATNSSSGWSFKSFVEESFDSHSRVSSFVTDPRTTSIQEAERWNLAAPALALHDGVNGIDEQESRRANGTEQGQNSNSPKNELEIDVVGNTCLAICSTDGHGKDGVGRHPDCHHVGSDSTIVILLLLRRAWWWFNDLNAVTKVAKSSVVTTINIKLFAWHLEFNSATLRGFCSSQIRTDSIVTLCAPRDIMRVAESEDLKIQVEERHQEIESNCAESADNKVGKEVVAKVHFASTKFFHHDPDRSECGNCEDIFAEIDFFSCRVNLRIRKRTSNEVEYLFEMQKGVDCGEECTIQPSTALRNEFWDSIWTGQQDSIVWFFEHRLPGTSVSPLPTKDTILCKIHGLALEVLTERSVSSLIVLEGMTDSSGLSRMLDILYSKFWEATSGLNSPSQFFPLPALISPAAPATVSWSCTDIQQNTDIGLQGLSEGVEEPAMTVEFLCVLLFHAEDHLAWHNSFFGSFELKIGIERYLCGILVDVTSDFTLVHRILCDTILVHSHGSKSIQSSRMNLFASIGNDADDNLLPAVLAPCSRFLSAAKVSDIAHDTMHGAGKVEFVFVVHGDTDEQLGLAGCVTNLLTELVATLNKLVGIACDGRVSHYRMVGILHSKISSPLMSLTSFLDMTAGLAPRRSCFPSGAGS
ncbi:chitin synthase, class II, partial [Aureobasidium melanogenum]